MKRSKSAIATITTLGVSGCAGITGAVVFFLAFTVPAKHTWPAHFDELLVFAPAVSFVGSIVAMAFGHAALARSGEVSAQQTRRRMTSVAMFTSFLMGITAITILLYASDAGVADSPPGFGVYACAVVVFLVSSIIAGILAMALGYVPSRRSSAEVVQQTSRRMGQFAILLGLLGQLASGTLLLLLVGIGYLGYLVG